MSDLASASVWFEFEWDNLVDLKNKKAYMNTPEFIKNLEKLKRIKLTDNVVQSKDGPVTKSSGYFRNNIFQRNPAVLFDQSWNIEDILQILLPFNDMIYSQPIPLLSDGIPIINGRTFTLGITNTCENKELAWQFLSYCMAERSLPEEKMFENKVRFRSGLPVNKQNFRKLLPPIARDILGIGNLRGYSFSGSGADVIEESIVQIEKWCSMKGRVKKMDLNLFLDLIYPDLYQYLIGEQTAEQTAARLQSKVEIYLNE